YRSIHCCLFFFNVPAPTEFYPLSLHTLFRSLVGIVMALMSAGQGFSITALMGMLMVVGIAVSNGILLVDDASRRFDDGADPFERSEEHTSELQSRGHLVCRLLLEKKKHNSIE